MRIKTSSLNELLPDPVNFLKVTATLMVFVQHMQSIKTKAMFDIRINDHLVGFLFRSPAWAGVWIFFIISGYLAGKGFASGRYSFSLKDIGKYYKNRILKIWLPSFVFVVTEMFIEHTSELRNHPELIKKMILCVFNGQGGYSGMGHTWYIFIIMWLYLAAPLIAFILHQINKHFPDDNKIWLIPNLVLFVFVVLAGFFYRQYARKHGFSWYEKIYTSPFANCDLFISGLILSFILSRIKTIKKYISIPAKIVSFAALISFIVLNEYCYLLADAKKFKLGIYQYIFPTIYIFVVLFFLTAHDITSKKKSPLSFYTVLRHPLRLTDAFAAVSFYAYLFHMSVANHLHVIFKNEGTVPGFIGFLFTAILISSFLGWIYSKGMSALTLSMKNIRIETVAWFRHNLFRKNNYVIESD